MPSEEWPDPDPIHLDLEDIERVVNERADEIIREITEMRIEIEEQAVWRWLVVAALCAMAWRLW